MINFRNWNTGLTVLFILTVAAGVCTASMPKYSNWEYIYSNGEILNVGSYGSPCVTDWNNDGKQDLIMGRFYNGRLDLYENTGTNDSPVLGPQIKMKADGKNIGVPHG